MCTYGEGKVNIGLAYAVLITSAQRRKRNMKNNDVVICESVTDLIHMFDVAKLDHLPTAYVIFVFCLVHIDDAEIEKKNETANIRSHAKGA